MIPVHPRLKLWMDIGEALAEVAEGGARKLQRQLRSRRKEAYKTLRPGQETAMWNALVVLLNRELRPHGSKVRLARYLGVPKQRLYDFLKGHSRMPDAEVLLRMIAWLASKQAGEDLSL